MLSSRTPRHTSVGSLYGIIRRRKLMQLQLFVGAFCSYLRDIIDVRIDVNQQSTGDVGRNVVRGQVAGHTHV